MGIHCGKVEKCIKHQGKIVYEGNVLKQTTAVADAGVGGGILLYLGNLANIKHPIQRTCCLIKVYTPWMRLKARSD